MADWPSLKDVRSWLRMQPSPDEDALIDLARSAAIDWCNTRTGGKWPPAERPDIPDTVKLAATILAAKLYRRRDSIDGTLGWGDLGVTRVARYDPDVLALLGINESFAFG